MGPLVRLHDVQIRTSTDPLVGPVDLDIAPGERVGLVGASGSGKSLTASVLLDQTPSSLRVTGEVSSSGPTLPTIGAVFQESASALEPLVRVGRQLGLPLRRLGLSRSERRARVAQQLERLGLDTEVARAWPLELSGGQRQRVALGLALMRRPELLVADEPTSALDAVTQQGVLTTMSRLLDEQGGALLLISHDLALVSLLCDRIVVMDHGRICETGTPEQVLAAPVHEATRRLARAARLLGVTA